MKTQTKYVSDCCKAELHYAGDYEGTTHGICTKCHEVCTPVTEDSIHRNKKLGKSKEPSKELKMIAILTWLYTNDNAFNSAKQWKKELLFELDRII